MDCKSSLQTSFPTDSRDLVPAIGERFHLRLRLAGALGVLMLILALTVSGCSSSSSQTMTAVAGEDSPVGEKATPIRGRITVHRSPT